MQSLVIGVLFLVALGYLGWRAWQSFARKEAGCAKGCGCSTDQKITSANKSGRLPV